MPGDPIYPLNSQFTRNILDIFRTSRDSLKNHLRNELIQSSLDPERIEFIIDGSHVSIRKRIKPVAERFIRLLYISAIDKTIHQIGTEDPLVQFVTEFTQADEDRITQVVDLYTTDIIRILADQKEFILKYIEGTRKETSVTQSVRQISDLITQTTLPEVDLYTNNVSLYTYNFSAFTLINAYCPFKEWIYIGDGIDHSSHEELNGMIIQSGVPFKVPAFHPKGDKRTREIPECELMYPGDRSDDPPLEQVSKCRCTIIGHTEKGMDEERRKRLVV